MYFPIAIGAVLAASLSAAQSTAGCEQISGNHYCSEVESMTYNNFGSSGSYDDVISFDGSTCSSSPTTYSGPLAPMNEEHSMHLRGPATLKQFAVYSPGSASSKRAPAPKPGLHQRRHQAHAKRAGSEWGRQAYYNAEEGTSEGLVFLNHHGGEGSGVFDTDLGNSLSYASSDGLSGASSSQTLADGMLPDNEEIVIMSDKECDEDCGTVRPGTVAYHGFDGESKLYLVELDMPLTGKTGWNEDMPALWALNAKVPRTLQYGKPECSCWATGCGEFDILEVLNSGNYRTKSTFHGDVAGGSSDWVERPADSTIKVGVLFDADSSSAQITVLDSSTEFSETISFDTIQQVVVNAVADSLASVFALGG